MSVRDLLVAATARSTSDRLVVADSGFENDLIRDRMEITNLARS